MTTLCRGEHAAHSNVAPDACTAMLQDQIRRRIETLWKSEHSGTTGMPSTVRIASQVVRTLRTPLCNGR